MAVKSTVFKAELQIADMDRHYYHTHTLTVARHPSETDERMMMRILAFIFNASERLTFANGLSESDEPDLWEKDLTGAIALWIMVGLPDEKQIKKACGRSERVLIYAYGGTAVDQWWGSLKHLTKLSNLEVMSIAQAESAALAELVERSMKIQCSIQDQSAWLSSENGRVELSVKILKK